MSCDVIVTVFLHLQALLHALGNRKGIQRFGNLTAPLDEAAVEVILVLSAS